MSEEKLDVLLIEDNPGDARLIEEMLGDAEELLQRVDVGAATVNGSQVHSEQRLSAGLDRLSELDVDVVLLDLNLPDSTGLDTLATVVQATEFVPVVVLTGLRDEQLGVEAIQRGAQDYLVKDEVTSDLLVRSMHHAIERNHQERERARRREQLEAVNHLNRVAQDVTHAVITTSTREQLERAVCERLVASDAYRFAWIGEVDHTNQRIVPRLAAGVEEGYLDDVTISLDGEDPRGPSEKAVKTHQVHVMQNMQTDPEFEPWREDALARDYRSSVAVPIVYEDLLYGVLNIYASSPNAFSEPEVDILSRLGDVIGHAIIALERKDALVSDAVLELEFHVGTVAEDLVAVAADSGYSVEFEDVVNSNDALVAYGRTAERFWPEFCEAAEESDSVDAVRHLTSDGEETRFELVTTAAQSLASAVATHGGRITAASITHSELRFVLEFPQGRDKHQLVELVQEHCPGATPGAQRTVQRSEADTDYRSVFQNRLTEKQQTALKTAFLGGYFDWPRTSTGEEIADQLGIAPATFSQHLRVAEQKLFDAVFD